MRWAWGTLLLAGSALGQLADPGSAPPSPPVAPAADGPVEQFLRCGAVRYWPSQAAADRAKPSLLLQAPFMVMEGMPEAAWVKPVFAEAGGRHTARIPLDAAAVVLAPGITSGPLRKGAAVTANSDTGGLPWIMVVRPGATVASFLIDTTAPCEITVGDAIEISSGAEFPLIETLSEDAAGAAGALATLTGWMDLPPLWALGYQHGDTSLTSDEAFLGATRRLRAERLPADGVWSARILLPANEAGPDRREWSEQLKQLGIHPLWRLPAGLDARSAEGVKAKVLKRPDGTPVSLGSDLAPDFSHLDTRFAWAVGPAVFLEAGFVGIEVMSGRLIGDAAFQAEEALGGPDGMDRYGAVYPTLASRALREVFGRAESELRPVLSTNVLSPGVQRYASVWMPAVGNDEAALADSLRRLQDASMSARFMVGMDIPGAKKGGDGAGLARWFGVASLMPMLRGNPDGERSCAPWEFGEDMTVRVRAALERRARLMPYLYTLVFEAFRFDEPIVRPLWTLDPPDASLHETPLVFLLGKEVLVDARAEGGELPALSPQVRDWMPFDVQPGLPRLYLKPGTMIPMGPVRQFAAESALDPLEFVVALDAQGQAQGMLYEDDGEGFGYTRNEGRIAYYAAQRTDKDVVVKMVRLDGAWPMAKRRFIARVLLPDGSEATGEFRDALDTHVTLP